MARAALLLAAAALLLAAAPRRAAGAYLQRPEQDCLNPMVQKVNQFDFFPEEYRSIIDRPQAGGLKATSTVTEAADFDIKYYGTYKVVRVKRFNKSYLLYQCGTPDPATLPAGAAEGVTPGMASFEIPLYSVAVTDTTVNGFLSELNLIDRVALASPYSVESCFQRLVDTKSQDGCKLVTPSPYFNKTDPGAEGRFRDANATMYDKADAVFVGFSGDAAKDILFPVTADPGPLNRAEWVKFVAAFFNKEVDANAAFDSIKGTYNTLRQLVATKNAEDDAEPRPSVAWVSTNATGVSFRLDPYKVTLIKDAGGIPFNRSRVESMGGVFSTNPLLGVSYVFVPKTADGLQALLKEADMIIDETYHIGIPSLASIAKAFGLRNLGDAQAGLPAFQNQQVYRWDGEQSPTGSSSWFEMAVARPDWVLMDLARAITPAVLADVLNVTNNIANKGPAGTDFNYLLQVDNKEDLGRPRVSAAKLCTTFPSCQDRSAFAICPNVFRDCRTGRLMQADPTQRCNSWAVCEPVELDGGSGASGRKSSGAQCPAAAAAATAAAALAAAALLAV
ncbi:MAG: hypothetical protein J3K34DRAFT_231734 [Monoraphidium minutum]|nr:MAG: hypothetical protein J3K34DRAFT_231734 [Monoraphidium minutum]